MPLKVAIIDYGMGNLKSVHRRLSLLNAQPIVTSDVNEVQKCDKIILPGVGHFGKAMENIKTLGLFETLNELVLQKKVPILGICLGLQLMAQRSEEGNVEGFGWINSEVIKFKVQDKLKYKVPQTGWNTVEICKGSKLFEGIPNHSEFYFVHSYHLESANKESILGKSEFNYSFISAIEEINIFGTQFHPEKSHDAGILLIKNFLSM